jgi:hypothetical protein
LTDYQADVARLLAPNRTPDSYLAGGAALHLEPNTKRYSNDLDYFNDSEERVASAFAEDRAVLEQAGYEVDVQLAQPGFVLALVGRDEPRDFIDVMHCHENVLSLGAMCWAACGKDPGFTPTGLLSLLGRRGKYRPEDFERLDLVEQPDLVAMKKAWRAALDEAEAFVRSRAADEIGCLYYSLKKRAFVGQFDPGDPDVRPHHGRPGGVLPELQPRG